jgi:hypothetical protein
MAQGVLMDVTKQFEYLNSILSKNNLNADWSVHVDNTISVNSMMEWDEIYQDFISKEEYVGLSYRYYHNGYFLIVIYADRNTYTLSDQSSLSSEDLLTIVKTLCMSRKILMWNMKHFMKMFLNHVEHSELISIYKNIIDTQILSYIVTQKKDGGLKDGQFIKSEYHEKVRIFIEKVYKNDAHYYYIPRNILSKAMSQEAISAFVCGKLFFLIADKLNMTRLLFRMQLLSIVLSDIEQGNIFVKSKSFSDLLEKGLTFKRETVNLLKYCQKWHTNQLPIEYKHMSSTTGRLSYSTKNGVNILSYPKDESRSLIIPEFDEFLSLDARGMEIFYIVSKNTKLLESIEITESFDIYQFVMDRLSKKISRSKLKNFLIRWLYGSTNFDDDERALKFEIEEKIPELVPKSHFHIPIYYQTDYGRVIKLNGSYTKFLNNIPQSEANDLMIDCVIKLWNTMRLMKMQSKIKLLIHDQVVLDIKRSERAVILRLIQRIFTGRFPYRYTIGEDWQEVS